MSEVPADGAAEHDPAARQFRVGEGGDAAVLQYRRSAERITLLHTEVPKALRGHGVAQRLARAALEYAKNESLRVVPLCPFVQSYVRKHPEYRDLIDE